MGCFCGAGATGRLTHSLKKSARYVFEALLLLAGTVIYNGMFYGSLSAGAYRFAVHENAMSTRAGEYGDFVIEIAIGTVSGLIALAIFRRLSGQRLLGFPIAAFTALYSGMPDAHLFGDTWTFWETNALFLSSAAFFAPIILAMSAVYAAYLWGLRVRPDRSCAIRR